ncbi:hypothetical protein D3C80_1561760 [compost metagenome]
MQGQAIHKPVADQNALAEQSAKQTEQLRGKNTAVEHTTGLQVRSEQEGKQQNGYKNAKRKRAGGDAEADSEQTTAHPFKGHNLDIKL